jgi:hypothetical protein
MIHRFIKITEGLYRGSAPTPNDVLDLHKKYNIKKIVSLDEECGEKIKHVCKVLGIKHIMMPLDIHNKSLLHLFSQDFKKLFLEGGPTYIHCHYGKDRTGLVAAIIEIKFLGKSPEESLNKARKLGFGVGVDSVFRNKYEKFIKGTKSSDDNNADAVSLSREPSGDNRTSVLDQATKGSFAPEVSGTKQYPYDIEYNPLNEQRESRKNYNQKINPESKSNSDNDSVPQVGVYNSDAGGRGMGGFVDPTSGFFYT